MKMQIEIGQRQGGNIHVVLQGRAGGESDNSPSDVFAWYVEICQVFLGLRIVQREDYTTSAKADGGFYITSPVAG